MSLNKEQNIEFFTKLEALVNEYRIPLQEALYDDEDGDPADPNDPVMLDSMTLVLCFRNLGGHSLLGFVAPEGQNPFLTSGMLYAAFELA